MKTKPLEPWHLVREIIDEKPTGMKKLFSKRNRFSVTWKIPNNHARELVRRTMMDLFTGSLSHPLGHSMRNHPLTRALAWIVDQPVTEDAWRSVIAIPQEASCWRRYTVVVGEPAVAVRRLNQLVASWPWNPNGTVDGYERESRWLTGYHVSRWLDSSHKDRGTTGFSSKTRKRQSDGGWRSARAHGQDLAWTHG